MRIQPSLLILVVLLFSLSAFADPSVRWLSLPARSSEAPILKALAEHFVLADYREIRIEASPGVSNSAVVYLLSKLQHRVEIVRIQLNAAGEVTSLQMNYVLRDQERHALTRPHCPDSTTEFITFAPNDDDLEQSITEGVALAAESKGLRTVRLLKEQATAQAYLNYMACPRLKGNFYDGDANPSEITTYDGTLSSQTMLAQLPRAFRHKVVNIWLACEAFNQPMLGTMITGTASQKFAAGKNDLLVGPSDQTGACAMKAALAGLPMTAAFSACYKQYDSSADHWGFAGNGSDLFGH